MSIDSVTNQLSIDTSNPADHTGGPISFSLVGSLGVTPITATQTFTVDLIDTCLTATLSFPSIDDLLGVRVNDPLGPFTRTIIASDSESTSTSTPNFCGDYTYSYAPTNAAETFAFT